LGSKSKVSYHFSAGYHQADDLRWVVSNKFWTASGVTAGIDMAAAFVRYWVEKHVGEAKAKGVADEILGVTEVS
jgi:transcriptional regulator GlxA family with amidase domain